MMAMLAVAKREYSSLFRVPLGWVVIALFVCLSSLFFVSRAVVPGAPATMRDFFGVWWGLALVVAPAISMRLFSEELRAGTIETMLTSPIGDASFVLGKFMAAVGFFLTMLIPTFAYVCVLEWLSRPDFGPILTGYLGLALVGMLYLSVGCVASVLTSSQTLAYLGTLFGLLALDLVPARIAPGLSEPIQRALYAISPSVQAADFHRGLVDTGRIMFFLSGSAWCLTVATLILQSRRWR